MDPDHINETVATLRFGERCALIEKEALNNATMLAGVLSGIDKQIKQLEEKILQKERWEMREEKRADELAEEGTFEAAAGRVEVKKISILVGAEEERKKLEELLIRREKFTSGSKNSNDPIRKKVSNVIGFGKEYAELYGLGESCAS